MVNDEELGLIIRGPKQVIDLCRLFRSYTRDGVRKLKAKLLAEEVMFKVSMLDLEELMTLQELVEAIKAMGESVQLVKGDRLVTEAFLENWITSCQETAAYIEWLDEQVLND